MDERRRLSWLTLADRLLLQIDDDFFSKTFLARTHQLFGRATHSGWVNARAGAEDFTVYLIWETAHQGLFLDAPSLGLLLKNLIGLIYCEIQLHVLEQSCVPSLDVPPEKQKQLIESRSLCHLRAHEVFLRSALNTLSRNSRILKTAVSLGSLDAGHPQLLDTLVEQLDEVSKAILASLLSGGLSFVHTHLGTASPVNDYSLAVARIIRMRSMPLCSNIFGRRIMPWLSVDDVQSVVCALLNKGVARNPGLGHAIKQINLVQQRCWMGQAPLGFMSAWQAASPPEDPAPFIAQELHEQNV